MSGCCWLWSLSGKTQTAPFNPNMSLLIQKRHPTLEIYTQKRLETVKTVMYEAEDDIAGQSGAAEQERRAVLQSQPGASASLHGHAYRE